MAKTIGAIKDFVHFLTAEPSRREEWPQHMRTILDVLEPRSAR